MALRTSIKCFKIKKLSSSELIVRRIPNYDSSQVIHDFKSTLNKTKISNKFSAAQLVKLPFYTFGMYPKSTFEQFINIALETVKKNDTIHIEACETIIESYMDNDIKFNIDNILKYLNEEKIHYSTRIIKLLISYHCELGEMKVVEELLDLLKLKNTNLRTEENLSLITGYTIAGETEKVSNLIKTLGRNESDFIIMFSKARAFASIGDVNTLMEIIDKMIDINKATTQKFCFEFYKLLVLANVSDSSLTPIVSHMMLSPNHKNIYRTIFSLNRAGYYSHSLKLVHSFNERFKYPEEIAKIITSFNCPDCPLNIYQNVLILLCDRLEIDYHKNLFSNLNFDNAYDLAQKIISDRSGIVFTVSLMNKAINDKSLTSIQHTLEFAFDHLKLVDLDFVLHFGFFPSMLKSGIVSSFEEILDLMPQYASSLLPPMLMHNMCTGNFEKYRNLISNREITLPISYFININATNKLISENLCSKELEILISEASKVFHKALVNRLASSYLTMRIIALSNSDLAMDNKLWEIAEKFKVTFTKDELQLMANKAVKHLDKLQQVSAKIEMTENY